MLGSWKIARLFGIDIRLHWTFLILLAVVLPGQEVLFASFILAVTFLSVLLHELGHSLVAKRYGVHVLDITFWPLGGMARMSEIPEEPRIEGWVAIAGPAVNFVLVALALPVALLMPALEAPRAVIFAPWAIVLINLMLGTFNLVPAFPMDGGRILRALLARRFDYVRATEIAVRVGRFVAASMLILTFVLGLLGKTLCVLPFIAVFVWFAGGRELMAVRLRHGRFPFGAAAPFAGEGSTDSEAGPRQPDSWEPSTDHRSGFSEESVRRLERFRGPLRQPPEED